MKTLLIICLLTIVAFCHAGRSFLPPNCIAFTKVQTGEGWYNVAERVNVPVALLYQMNPIHPRALFPEDELCYLLEPIIR